MAKKTTSSIPSPLNAEESGFAAESPPEMKTDYQLRTIAGDESRETLFPFAESSMAAGREGGGYRIISS
jgi:hypothetical protein